MGYVDFMLAVMGGNLLTVCVVWACFQFHKHDYKAPWLAYLAFIMPVAFLGITIAVIEGLPPHLDALAPQQASASDP